MTQMCTDCLQTLFEIAFWKNNIWVVSCLEFISYYLLLYVIFLQLNYNKVSKLLQLLFVRQQFWYLGVIKICFYALVVDGTADLTLSLIIKVAISHIGCLIGLIRCNSSFCKTIQDFFLFSIVTVSFAHELHLILEINFVKFFFSIFETWFLIFKWVVHNISSAKLLSMFSWHSTLLVIVRPS